MEYTYKYPRPAVTADCVVMTREKDPRHRTISVAYIALVDKAMPVKGPDDADKAEWWSIYSLPDLAFDHEEILQDALEIYESILEDE